MQFYEKKYLSSHDFWALYCFNKHEMIEIGNQTGEKSQVLMQVLE